MESLQDEYEIAREHSVLNVERRGNALIVRPRGDIPSFSATAFRGELGRVRRLATDQRIRHIVCDFSAGEYFSRDLVVPLFELRDSVQGRGTLVMCGLSDDMQSVMSRSDSGTHVLQFDDRASALATLEAETPLERARHFSRRNAWLVFTVAAALAVPAAAFALRDVFVSPFDGRTFAHRRYLQLLDRWEGAREMAQAGAGQTAWQTYGLDNATWAVDTSWEIRAVEDRTPADNEMLRALLLFSQIMGSPQKRMGEQGDRFVAAMNDVRSALSAAGADIVPDAKRYVPKASAIGR